MARPRACRRGGAAGAGRDQCAAALGARRAGDGRRLLLLGRHAGDGARAGGVACGLGAAAAGRSPPARPVVGWLGGLCGATYVTSVFLLIPEIGAAPTIALTVAGQQLASLVVDRYGLLRLERRPLPAARLAGIGVLLAGVTLIQVA